MSLNFRAYSFLIEGALDCRMVSATSVERPEAMMMEMGSMRLLDRS